MKTVNFAKAFFMLVATLSLWGCFAENTTGSTYLPTGSQMPEFSVSGPEGTVSTADLAGGRTLVVLFRSTCADCRRELPKVEEAFRAVGAESDVRFVAITKEENYATVVPEYWAEMGSTMPYYFDPDGSVFSAFGVTNVPSLYLFGSDGKVSFLAIETFDFDADKLTELINELK